MSYNISNVSLMCWNIDGAYYKRKDGDICKFDDTDVHNSFLNHQIVSLVETHCDASQKPHVDGFAPPVCNVRPKTPGAPYHSGGILIYIKNEISKGVTILPETNSEYRWIRLNKSFFNMSHDIYICTVYISNGSFGAKNNDDILMLIENDIARFNRNGSKIIVCGDFNARTCNDPDYLEGDGYSELDDVLDLPVTLIENKPIPRNNKDTHAIDKRGKNLLQFCKITHMRIINGRVFGDTYGNFTCYSHNGNPSTIDYMLTTENMLKFVNHFHVENLNVHSIHCPISMSFSTGSKNVNSNDINACKTDESSQSKFTWSSGDDTKLQEVLSNDDFQQKLTELNLALDGKNCDVDKSSVELTNIISEAAKQANIKCRSIKPNKCQRANKKCKSSSPLTKKSKPWFDNKCKELKIQYDRVLKCAKRNPFERSIKFDLNKIRKLYKSTVKNNKRLFERNIWSNLDKFHKTRPKDFWKLLSDLKGLDDEYKQNPIPMDEWVKHFTKLFNTSMKIDPVLDKHITSFIEENKNRIFNEINFSIKDTEVINAIKFLKSGKSAGVDGILNEMFKAGVNSLTASITKLFNVILCKGKFPSSWRDNTLTPLYKNKGDANDPKNYRGIAVASSFSKLFLTIMQQRLQKFTSEKGLVPDCQIAYQKNCTTSDHILTLKNIIDKYVNRVSKCRLFVCFVDFRAAFDTVWRKAMLYKLVKMGVSGNFFNVIESMYCDVSYRVKLNGALSSKITSDVGVKQGCVLSPLLFNLFLSDLPNTFSEKCDPITLCERKLSCLMFADDLVLISETHSGLQNCLSELYNYCKKWGLIINTDKTKVVIFNKTGHKYKNFQFNINGERIDVVTEYCYLGIIFTACGSFTKANKVLYEKSLRAMFMLKRINSQSNAKIELDLFDALVLPIINYASVILGPLTFKFFNSENIMAKCNDYPAESLNIKFCKYLLGVHKFSMNNAIRGELGRYPIVLNVLNNSVRFYKRIFSSVKENSLVALSCKDTEVRNLGHGWFKIMFELQNGICGPGSFLTRIRNIYCDQWTSWLANQNEPDKKLRTYSTYKSKFEMENYILQYPLEKRRNLTKLRTSAHNLAIETGRYVRPNKIDSDKRFCFNCKDKVETEYHMIFDCELYTEERDLLKSQISEFTDFDFSNPLPLFTNFMSCRDFEIGAIFCDFINSCFIKRRQHLSLIVENNILRRPETTITRTGRVSKRPNRIDI